MREAKIDHVTDLIGQFQGRIKSYAGILLIESGPVLVPSYLYTDLNEVLLAVFY